jgi:hypothetical protein
MRGAACGCTAHPMHAPQPPSGCLSTCVGFWRAVRTASPARRGLPTARAAAAQALRKTGTGGSLDENNLERLFWRENHAVRWAPGSARCPRPACRTPGGPCSFTACIQMNPSREGAHGTGCISVYRTTGLVPHHIRPDASSASVLAAANARPRGAPCDRHVKDARGPLACRPARTRCSQCQGERPGRRVRAGRRC